jgi:hypothetical protein
LGKQLSRWVYLKESQKSNLLETDFETTIDVSAVWSMRDGGFSLRPIMQ